MRSKYLVAVYSWRVSKHVDFVRQAKTCARWMGIPLKSKFYLIFDTFTPSHFILHKMFDQIFRQINMDAMNFYELCLCFFFWSMAYSFGNEICAWFYCWIFSLNRLYILSKDDRLKWITSTGLQFCHFDLRSEIVIKTT